VYQAQSAFELGKCVTYLQMDVKLIALLLHYIVRRTRQRQTGTPNHEHAPSLTSL